ncbi:MAG: hypothetical protein IKK81_04180 [Prevotella sp.]|nr:hypothetical protein [Prevotella sp.]
MKYLLVVLAVIFGLISFVYTIGYFEMLFGLITPTAIPIALEGTLEYSDIKMQLIGQDIGSMVLIVISIILSSFFYSLYRRLNKRKKDTFDKDSIKAPFVLYLRSFVDDKTTKKRISFVNDVRTEEEVLVSVLSDVAPVYAIGDPKDKKMPLGASRIYVDDEHWKSTVIDMMNRAVVVVLRLGKTDSFWWEVETAVKNISLEKVMFVVPESKTFSNVVTLYKILLEHNVDIKHLDVSIERKNQGSISSFLYFEADGQAITTEVKTPRFTRLVLSYENILGNALSGFREKYGLKTKRKRTVRWARIIEILLIGYIIFIGASKTYSDLVSLKFQMPYEFVEKCVESPDFVNKYSNEINGTNLTWGIVEARKGTFGLEDEKYKLLFLVEACAIQSMSDDEFSQLQAASRNMLLMIKKYVPDSYDSYVKILSEAAIIAIQHPDEIMKLIQQYKQNIDAMPLWVYDLANSEDMPKDEYEYMMKYNSIIVEHMDEDEIADVLKTLSSQAISEK